MMMPLIYLVYDSIDHSVFEGQVLNPLIKQLALGLHSHIILVSFEQHLTEKIKALKEHFQKTHPGLTITLLKRNRFLHTALLFKDVRTLRAILKPLPPYQLMARGPLAGYLAKKAVTKQCTSLTIQARGLLAEEYSYAHENAKGRISLLQRIRLHQLYAVERQAYSKPKTKIPFYIEAVSPALRQYLELTYTAPTAAFTEPLFDTQDQISQQLKQQYRTARRIELGITPDAPVYLYSGSLKPWQCAQETVALFKTHLERDPKSIFLVLTPDVTQMQKLLQKATLSPHTYRALSIADHQTVMEYTCAADYGFLLRKEHLMNWVSRPTKLLEYQAAGLTVLHNNTIALLAEQH